MNNNELKDITLPMRTATFTYCNPAVGSFGLEKEEGKMNHWDHCREQFAAKFDEKTTGFYFSHKVDKIGRAHV